LACTILKLLRHPESQSKLQKKLDQVTNRNRAPCLADRPKYDNQKIKHFIQLLFQKTNALFSNFSTPYTEALIQETFRMSSIVPFNLIHSTTQDVKFHGYTLPKDTLVITNLHSVHHDVKTWGDPENFRPERFLSPDGKTVKRSESLIPFSTGKRVCVGEVLARDQIYVFLTNIFYKFKAVPDPKDPKPSMEPEGSFALQAKPFTVIFKERL